LYLAQGPVANLQWQGLVLPVPGCAGPRADVAVLPIRRCGGAGCQL